MRLHLKAGQPCETLLFTTILNVPVRDVLLASPSWERHVSTQHRLKS